MFPDLFRTLIFNIRAFGLRNGLKLPVYIYSRIKIYNIGRIEIKCPVRRGMWRIGMHHDNSAQPYTIFDNRGIIELYGKAWLHHGSRLTNTGTIVFGGNNIISHETVFDIRDRLEFGQNVSIGFCSEFIDNDMHYMIDIDTHEIEDNHKPIKIGNFNWFGSHTYVKKGTVTPDYTIVASPNALLLRDYTKDVQPYSTLGGTPAKVIATGKRRILNIQSEYMIRKRFTETNKRAFKPEGVTNLDEFCSL